MNHFLNIAEEFSVSMCIRHRNMGLGMESFNDRSQQIAKLTRLPLAKRIYNRGCEEQYKHKFLPNYYGGKRLSRSHVFTFGTITCY